MLLTSVGCETDNGLVETNAEFEPYWWRHDPHFDDKEVDEEATIALGDPNVVIMASPPRSPRDLMFDRVTAKIREVYDLSEDDVYPIADVMFYHADTMRSWNLQGVDWILFDAEMQKVIPIQFCNVRIEPVASTHQLYPVRRAKRAGSSQ